MNLKHQTIANVLSTCFENKLGVDIDIKDRLTKISLDRGIFQPNTRKADLEKLASELEKKGDDTSMEAARYIKFAMALYKLKGEVSITLQSDKLEFACDEIESTARAMFRGTERLKGHYPDYCTALLNNINNKEVQDAVLSVIEEEKKDIKEAMTVLFDGYHQYYNKMSAKAKAAGEAAAAAAGEAAAAAAGEGEGEATDGPAAGEGADDSFITFCQEYSKTNRLKKNINALDIPLLHFLDHEEKKVVSKLEKKKQKEAILNILYIKYPNGPNDEDKRKAKVQSSEDNGGITSTVVRDIEMMEFPRHVQGKQPPQ